MKKFSIKLRMALAYAACALVITMLAVFVTLFMGSSVASSGVKQSLRADVTDMAEAIKSSDNGATLADEYIKEYSKIGYLAVYTKDGEYVCGNLDGLTVENAPKINSKDYGLVTVNSDEYYTYDKKLGTVDGLGSKLYLRGFVPTETDEQIADSTLNTGIVMLIIAIVLYFLAAYFITKRMLVRLESLRQSTCAIMDGKDLHRSIPVGKYNDEIDELTEVINNMFERLDRSFERERQFVSDVSHELRTPIAVIHSQCQSFDENDPQETISTVEEQADRMNKLISEMLELSRIDRGMYEKKFEKTNVTELLNATCAQQKEIHSEPISLEWECEDKLEATLDPSLFIRLVINLVNNAYRYGKEGGHIKVRLESAQMMDLQPAICLSVSDDGIGIAKEDLPKIFDRFYRADKARSTVGSGIGLSMVKWIVTHHGGSIKVDSTQGEGSEFVVMLPVNQKNPDSEQSV